MIKMVAFSEELDRPSENKYKVCLSWFTNENGLSTPVDITIDFYFNKEESDLIVNSINKYQKIFNIFTGA